jgi:hypothetical protein
VDDDSNLWKSLISIANRSTTERPITNDMLVKSIFASFLCTAPLSDNILSEAYKRNAEAENIIRFMNAMYAQSLAFWAPDTNDATQTKLKRIYGSKSIMVWQSCSGMRFAQCCASMTAMNG